MSTAESEIVKPDIILNSVDEVIASMPERFHPENCMKLDAVFRWNLKNPERSFSVHVKEGTFTIHDDTEVKANVTIECDTQVYLKLVNGQMKDVIAVITGKLRVKGSISMAQKLNRIFI